jgi:hypothetical protein
MPMAEVEVARLTSFPAVGDDRGSRADDVKSPDARPPALSRDGTSNAVDRPSIRRKPTLDGRSISRIACMLSWGADAVLSVGVAPADGGLLSGVDIPPVG